MSSREGSKKGGRGAAAKSTEHIYPPVWVQSSTDTWTQIKWDSLTPAQRAKVKLTFRSSSLCYVVRWMDMNSV